MDIEIKNLVKKYNGQVIFNGVDMVFKKGLISVISGPSGIGKTTILNILSGIDNDYEGTVLGVDKEKISYVFQEPRLLDHLTAYENIKFVLNKKLDFDKIEEIINKVLETVELSEYKSFYPNELSGGMKQRVSIARAFAYPGDLILMDEPFSGIDEKLKMQMMRDIKKLQKKQTKTIVFVTHNMEEARFIGDEHYIIEGKPSIIRKQVK
jgi:NitT/TauT family transport system ATP-binding protein